MFAKFPQLWRLERMLSKAQVDDASALGFSLSKSPSPRMRKSRDFFRRKINYDPLDDMVEVLEKQAKLPHRALNLYDSDDLTGFKKPVNHDKNILKTRNLAAEKSTIKLISAESDVKSPSSLTMRKTVSKGSIPGQKSTAGCHWHETKKAFLRATQEVQQSDLLSVLSDEETEECPEEYRRSCRYPLPTMPLAIMIPASQTDFELSPFKAEIATERAAKSDKDIEALKHIRNRLSSCFELFDDLCTSFCGPQNLDCFLRSMLSCNSFRNSKRHSRARDGVVIRSQSVIKQEKRALFNIVPPEVANTNEGSTPCGSRLLRSTISTKMKHIDVRNKDVASDAGDLTEVFANCPTKKLIDSSQSVSKHCEMFSKKPHKKGMSTRRNHRLSPSPEDTCEDMLLRVRRHIMRMPWIGTSNRNPLSQTIV